MAAIKKLENETIDICEKEEQLEELVIESTDYEIYTKQKHRTILRISKHKLFHQHRS